MEICTRKYMFGNKSTFGLYKNGQNIRKNVKNEKYFYEHSTSFISKKFHTLIYNPFKNLQV